MASSSSSKPTGVHFALVFFVMTTLILALLCYMVAKDNSQARADKIDADTKASKAVTERNNAATEILALKQILAYNNDAVGAAGDAANASLIGQLGSDLVKFAGEQVQPNPQAPTVRATLIAMRAKLDSLDAERQQLQINVRNLTAELDAEKKNYLAKVEQIQKSQGESELSLQNKTSSVNEQIAAKDRTITQITADFRRAQREMEALRDTYDQYRRETDIKMDQMAQTVREIQGKLNRAEDLSFDHADGKIVRVDNNSRVVWIDLGTDDRLREQVSFSVYVKNHQGVGRGKEDIKAKIEVSEIRDKHLAQARIVQEDFSRPIQIGDPIYSPVWERGMKEYFSFVGIIDLDGDGKTDFELMRTLLENAGAGVELFIDETGERKPAGSKLTTKSKFLVVGNLEDPTNFPTMDTVKQGQIKKVAEEAKLLDEEALSRGIKAVNIRDFLNYMGYETQQNLFIPGEKGKFQLQSGAHSDRVNGNIGANRFSEGVTSERFSPENLKKLGNGAPAK